jgi:hypothetical protein
MSFGTGALPGTPKNTLPLKECPKCGQHKEPSGGVQIGPGKWRCHECWIRFTLRKK